MKEISWQEINRKGEIKTKTRTFQTEKAADKFLEKLHQKDSFYRILAYR